MRFVQLQLSACIVLEKEIVNTTVNGKNLHPMFGSKKEFKKLPHNLKGGRKEMETLQRGDPPGRKVGRVILHCSQGGIHLSVDSLL